MYSILPLNKIAPEGQAILKNRFQVGEGEKNPHAILVRSSPVDTADYSRLLVVGRAGAGVNNITVSKATERGICVLNTPGANANAVAELVFIMLGFVARNIEPGLQYLAGLRTGDLSEADVDARVEKDKSRFKGFELAGKTFGVLGLGKIGVLVANYGVYHGMRVLAYDPFPTIQNIHHLHTKVEICGNLREVVAASEILTVHVPLTQKTKGLIGPAELPLLKKGVILVNYARKGIIDDVAVSQGIRSGKIGAYVSDFPSPVLFGETRVHFTPHLGASTSESEENCAVMIARQVSEYLQFGNIVHSVNFPVVEAPIQKSTVDRVVVINRDVPKMIAHMTEEIGKAGLNIQSLTNESNGKIGYNIIDFDEAVPTGTIEAIRELKDVIRVRHLHFGTV